MSAVSHEIPAGFKKTNTLRARSLTPDFLGQEATKINYIHIVSSLQVWIKSITERTYTRCKERY